MKYIKQAEKLAFEEIPPTCPVVRSVLRILGDRYEIPDDVIEFAFEVIVSEGTGKLRDSQIAGIAQLLSFRKDNEILRKKLGDLPKITPKKKR